MHRKRDFYILVPNDLDRFILELFHRLLMPVATIPQNTNFLWRSNSEQNEVCDRQTDWRCHKNEAIALVKCSRRRDDV